MNSAAATDHPAQTAQKKRAAPTLPASGSPSEARPSSRSLVELVSISKLDRNLVLTNVIKSLREYVPALLPDWKTAIRVAANTSRAEPREPFAPYRGTQQQAKLRPERRQIRWELHTRRQIRLISHRRPPVNPNLRCLVIALQRTRTAPGWSATLT